MLAPDPFHHHFRQDEDGAVSVDWVVLTAALVGLALAAFASAQLGVTSVTGAVNTSMSSAEINLDPIPP